MESAEGNDYVLNLSFANPWKSGFVAAGMIILTGVMTVIGPAVGNTQVPVATAPYSVTTFATAPAGLSAPDSVTASVSR
jgi:hypothetical protein